MSNYITSLIRTYVPIVAGAIASFLATLGLDVDGEATAGLVIFLTALFQAVYYAVVRYLEKKYPKVGVLLGVASKPNY